MTIERNYVIGVEDITSLLFTCEHCQMQVIVQLDPKNSKRQPPHVCGGCNQVLTPQNGDGNSNLLSALRTVLGTVPSENRVKLIVPIP